MLVFLFSAPILAGEIIELNNSSCWIKQEFSDYWRVVSLNTKEVEDFSWSETSTHFYQSLQERLEKLGKNDFDTSQIQMGLFCTTSGFEFVFSVPNFQEESFCGTAKLKNGQLELKDIFSNHQNSYPCDRVIPGELYIYAKDLEFIEAQLEELYQNNESPFIDYYEKTSRALKIKLNPNYVFKEHIVKKILEKDLGHYIKFIEFNHQVTHNGEFLPLFE